MSLGINKYLHMNTIMLIADYRQQDYMLTLINNIILTEKNKIDQLKFCVNYFGSPEQFAAYQKQVKMFFPKYDITVKDIRAEFPDIVKDIDECYEGSGHFDQIPTSSVYFRFYLPHAWPEVEDVALYLDVDVLVCQPISNLFDHIRENPGHVLYSVEGDRPEKLTKIKWEESITKALEHDRCNELYQQIQDDYSYHGKVLEPGTHGFNGGVWALDFVKFRENKQLLKILEFYMHCQAVGRMFWHNDQGIMNIVFQDYFKLDEKWNRPHYGWLRQPRKLIWGLQDAGIAHFNGDVKPWLDDVDHPCPEAVELWRGYHAALVEQMQIEHGYTQN